MVSLRFPRRAVAGCLHDTLASIMAMTTSSMFNARHRFQYLQASKKGFGHMASGLGRDLEQDFQPPALPYTLSRFSTV